MTYAVRLPTAHPIHENFRVRLFQQMLQGPLDDPDCVANLGELMYQVSRLVSGRYAKAEQPEQLASNPPAHGAQKPFGGGPRLELQCKQERPAAQEQCAGWHSNIRTFLNILGWLSLQAMMLISLKSGGTHSAEPCQLLKVRPGQ